MDSPGSSSSSFRWRRVLDEEWDPDGREKRQNDRSRRLAYLKNIHMGYYTYTGFKKKKHTKHVIPWPPISAHPPLWLEKRRDVSRIVESLHLRIRDMAKIKLGSMDVVTAPLGATL